MSSDSCGTITLGGSTDDGSVDQPVIGPDDVSISCLATSVSGAVDVGDRVSPLYSVTNFAGVDVRVTVAITANGREIDSEQIDIPQGQTGSSRLPIVFDSPGDYDVAFKVTDVQVI